MAVDAREFRWSAYVSRFQRSLGMVDVTQGFALGWYVVGPLALKFAAALSVCGGAAIGVCPRARS